SSERKSFSSNHKNILVLPGLLTEEFLEGTNRNSIFVCDSEFSAALLYKVTTERNS
ncbi:Hypothetical predicted protein, partial [Cloeon dipterum]